MLPLVEVQNGSSKNVGPVSISERFLSLGVSKSRFRPICASQSLDFFADVSQSLGFVVFVCPLGLQKSNFFRVNRYIGYPTNRLRKSETRQRSILMGFR